MEPHFLNPFLLPDLPRSIPAPCPMAGTQQPQHWGRQKWPTKASYPHWAGKAATSRSRHWSGILYPQLFSQLDLALGLWQTRSNTGQESPAGLLPTEVLASPLCPTRTCRVPLLKSMSKAWSVFTHCRRSRAGCPRSSMLGRSPPLERRVCISHWSHTWEHCHQQTHNQTWTHNSGCPSDQQPVSQESHNPVQCGRTMTQHPTHP